MTCRVSFVKSLGILLLSLYVIAILATVHIPEEYKPFFSNLERKIGYESRPVFTSKKIIDDLRETELKPPLEWALQNFVYEFQCDLCDVNNLQDIGAVTFINVYS